MLTKPCFKVINDGPCARFNYLPLSGNLLKTLLQHELVDRFRKHPKPMYFQLCSLMA